MSNSSAAVPAPSTAPAPSPPPPSPSSPPPSSSPAPSSPPPSSTPAPSPPAPPAPPPASPPPASSSPTLPTPPPPSIPPPQTPSSTLSPPPPSHPSPPAIKASPPPPRKATTSSPTAHSPPSPSSSSQISGVALFGIALAGVVAVTVIIALLICLMRKGKRRKPYPSEQYYPPPGNLKYQYPFERKQQWDPSSTSSSDVQVQIPLPPPPPPFPVSDIGTTPPKAGSSYREPQSLGGSRSSFTYEELAVATDNFAASNILGVGGFGYVYKGTLPGGQLVAVKQLKTDGCQGEREFKAEVDIIGRIHHRHLVSLVGYCIAGSQRLLVYDFVPNRTLEYHLHGKGIPVMDWSKRMKIAVGAARGLAYLHEDCHPRIIHRDIKSSNILLDNNFEAQVSDFGLAKLTSDVNTHVTTRVMGTFGYLAPEYASSGKLTEKSDVFSFGVVLLELLTGRKPVDSSPLGDESLVEWARPLLTQILEGADLGLLIDPRLEGRYDKQEAMGMVEAAALCVRHSSHRRPRMGQVVRLLEDVDLSDVNQGVRPGHSTIYSSSYTSTDYDSSQYGADIKRFQQTALGSQEYGSEYSRTTSEYGVNPSASSSEFQNSKEMEDGTVERHSVKKKGTLTTASVSSSTEYSTSKEMENRRIYLS